MKRIIVLPDDGEWVLVPAAAVETLHGIRDADWRKWDELASPEEFVRWAKSRANHAAMLAAGAPCKVVELPEREEIPMHNCCDIERALGRNEVLDEIERRAK